MAINYFSRTSMRLEMMRFSRFHNGIFVPAQ
jgi:hypothetical protein